MTRIIVAFTGRLGAGKSTAARYLREAYGFGGTAITDPLDEMARPLLRRMGVPEGEIEERLVGSLKNAPLPNHPWLSARNIKQALGREFRDAIGEPVGDGRSREFFQNLWLDDNADEDRLVHESVRYPFEGDGLRARGAILIRILDPDFVEEGSDQHESEVATDLMTVDYDVANPKEGPAHLHGALDVIMAKHGIRKVA